MSPPRTALSLPGAPLLLLAFLWLAGYLSFWVVSPYDGGKIPEAPCPAFFQQVMRSYIVLAALTVLLALLLHQLIKANRIGRPGAALFMALFLVLAFLEIRYCNLQSDGPVSLGFWASHCDSYAAYRHHYLPF